MQRLQLTTSIIGQDLDSVASGIASDLTRSDSSTAPGDCSARSSRAASLSSAASVISSNAGTTKKDSSASRWGVRTKQGDQQSLQRWQSLWFGERSMGREQCQWYQFRPNDDLETWECPDVRQPCQWDRSRSDEDPETWEMPDSMQPCQWDHFVEGHFRTGEHLETWDYSDSWHPYQWHQFKTDEDPETWQNPDNWQRCQWDQFKTNEELFGVASTFQDDLSQYTTPLDIRRVPWEVQRLADAIASEIANDRCSGAGGHGSPGMGSDNGSESLDEEDLWAAVPREAPGSSTEDLPAPVPDQVQHYHSRDSGGYRRGIGCWFSDLATPGVQLASDLWLQLSVRLQDSKVRLGVTIVCFNVISSLMRLIFANVYFATGFLAIFLTAVAAYVSGWHPPRTTRERKKRASVFGEVEDSPHAQPPSDGAKAAQVERPSRGTNCKIISGLPCTMCVAGQAAYWLDCPEHFRGACRRLSEKQPAAMTAPPFAVVPVADPYGCELCLLCVASALGETFVFDLRSRGAGPAVAAALGRLMKDPAHTKVLHADRRGVRAFERQFGADVFEGNFWNTQVVDLVLRRRVHREGTIAEFSCLQKLCRTYCGDLAVMDDAFEEISPNEEDQNRLLSQLTARAKAILLLASRLTSALAEAFGEQQDFTLHIAELSRLHAKEEELDDAHDPAQRLQQHSSQAFLQAVARAVRGMELRAVVRRQSPERATRK